MTKNEKLLKFANTLENNLYLCHQMVIIFDKVYLKDLYCLGKTDDKKYRFQPEIVRKYVKVINVMRIADNINDLMRIGGLHYERLSGNKKGISSVRVNDKYRIEFIEHTEGENKIATICNITELTNHYQ